jgi:branched-chain amino acid transport system substrate-binding protein
VPGATGPAKSIRAAALQAVGVAEPDIIAIPPGVPDMSSQIQAAMAKDPQLVHIIGDASFCTSAISALRTADYKGDILMISNCVEKSTIDKLGDQLEGILVSYAAGEDPANHDYQTFKAVIDKYASDSDIALTGTPVGVLTVVVGFNRAMKAATGELTPASISAAPCRTPQPMPTIDGATFQCNGTAVLGNPGGVTAAFVVATLDKSGQPTNHTAG